MRSTSSPLAVSMMIGMFSPRAAQAPADRQAVLARQHEVEDHQVVALARELPVHLGRVGHGAHRVSLLGQIAVQQVAQPPVVVDDQNPGFLLCHGSDPISDEPCRARHSCKSLLPSPPAKQIVTKKAGASVPRHPAAWITMGVSIIRDAIRTAFAHVHAGSLRDRTMKTAAPDRCRPGVAGAAVRGGARAGARPSVPCCRRRGP